MNPLLKIAVLLTAPVVLNGAPAHWQAPLATGIAVSAACLAAAVWRFARREI